MRTLTKAESRSFWLGLRKRFNIDRPRWLLDQFSGIYENELVLDENMDSFISMISKYLREINCVVVSVFSDDVLSAEINENAIFQVRVEQLGEFVKRKVAIGYSNYYITPTRNSFQWILTLCHEGDIHIHGSKSFVKGICDFKLDEKKV